MRCLPSLLAPALITEATGRPTDRLWKEPWTDGPAGGHGGPQGRQRTGASR